MHTHTHFLLKNTDLLTRYYHGFYFPGKGAGQNSPSSGNGGGGGGGHAGRGGRAVTSPITGDSYGSFTEPLEFGMLCM